MQATDLEMFGKLMSRLRASYPTAYLQQDWEEICEAWYKSLAPFRPEVLAIAFSTALEKYPAKLPTLQQVSQIALRAYKDNQASAAEQRAGRALPPPAKTAEDAKRQFQEACGSALAQAPDGPVDAQTKPTIANLVTLMQRAYGVIPEDNKTARLMAYFMGEDGWSVPWAIKALRSCVDHFERPPTYGMISELYYHKDPGMWPRGYLKGDDSGKEDTA